MKSTVHSNHSNNKIKRSRIAFFQLFKKPVKGLIALLSFLVIGLVASASAPPELPLGLHSKWGIESLCDNSYLVCMRIAKDQEPTCVDAFSDDCFETYFEDADHAEDQHDGTSRESLVDAYEDCMANVPSECTVSAQCLRTWLGCLD